MNADNQKEKLDSEKGSIFQLFQEFDRDGNGLVSRDDLIIKLKGKHVPLLTPHIHKFNQVSLEHFQKLVELNESFLRAAFQHFDVDNSGSYGLIGYCHACLCLGYIDENDVIKCMKSLNKHATMHQARL